ncbi:hypothetical protein GN958_ATG05021 [Phytophthora infestans]|uniref:Uncharacterized protein n=1 Tax=Phytophthora infestans TaxID=4787 RepID=A0A8S9V2Q3_PHYIN|nr:hypothetical protein GN958_ATG05021 [Phytophthora infestans]
MTWKPSSIDCIIISKVSAKGLQLLSLSTLATGQLLRRQSVVTCSGFIGESGYAAIAKLRCQQQPGFLESGVVLGLTEAFGMSFVAESHQVAHHRVVPAFTFLAVTDAALFAFFPTFLGPEVAAFGACSIPPVAPVSPLGGLALSAAYYGIVANAQCLCRR